MFLWSVFELKDFERTGKVASCIHMLARGAESCTHGVVRLEWSNHALRLRPSAVLVKADLVCCSSEQVATVLVERDIIHCNATVCNVSELALFVEWIDPADVVILPWGGKVGALIGESDLLDFGGGRSLELHGYFLVADVVNFDRASLKAYCEYKAIWMEFDLRDGSIFLEFGERNSLLDVVETPGTVRGGWDHVVV